MLPPRLVPVPHLYQGFPLDRILQHPALVFIPYSVNAFKQTELYSLSMPLLVPSLTYYRSHRFGPDRSSGSRYYCNSPDHRTRPGHPATGHGYSPNVEVGKDGSEDDLEAEMHWLQFADFYTRPHIVHFDDCGHLERLMEDTDFGTVHDNMVGEVEKRAEKVVENWRGVIETI